MSRCSPLSVISTRKIERWSLVSSWTNSCLCNVKLAAYIAPKAVHRHLCLYLDLIEEHKPWVFKQVPKPPRVHTDETLNNIVTVQPSFLI